MGDLHSYNVIVRPDGRVAVIDFEGASDAGEAQRQVLANPAFAPPSSRTGLDADRYALACLGVVQGIGAGGSHHGSVRCAC
jgi:hypothetical protein